MKEFENVNPFGKTKDYPVWRKKKNEKGDFVPTQDPMLYVTDESQLRNLASIPYSKAVGDPVIVGNGTDHQAPGIMVLDYISNYGYNDKRSGALNKAADALFNKITQGYSTNVSFEAPDIVMLQWSVIEIAGILSEMRRAYGLLKRYSNYNTYFGRTLLNALHVDYDDWRENMALFRERYNTYVQLINDTVKVPAVSNLLKRRVDINGNIFADDLGIKYQMYAFHQRVTYKYNGYSSTTGTALEAIDTDYVISNGGINNWFSLIDEMVSRLVGDSDVNNMSGAILRVYGEDGCMKIATIPDSEDVITPIIYDEVWLTQIHNAMTVPMEGGFRFGWVASDASNDIITLGDLRDPDPTKQLSHCLVKQSADGTILSQPVIQIGVDGCQYFTDNLILDVLPEMPDAGITMDATRLKYALSSSAIGNPATNYPVHAGCEIVFQFRVITGYIQPGTSEGYIYQLSRQRTSADLLDIIELFSRFEMAPFIYYHKSTGSLMDLADKVIGDYHNVTTISRSYLANLNDKVFFGLLKIPENAKSITKK